MENIYRSVIREWLEELRNDLRTVESRIAELRRKGYSPVRPYNGPIFLKAEALMRPSQESEELYEMKRRRPVIELRIQYLEDRVR